MSRMGVSPNQGSSLSNAAFWIRLLLPLSSEPSFFRRLETYVVAYEAKSTLPYMGLTGLWYRACQETILPSASLRATTHPHFRLFLSPLDIGCFVFLYFLGNH